MFPFDIKGEDIERYNKEREYLVKYISNKENNWGNLGFIQNFSSITLLTTSGNCLVMDINDRTKVDASRVLSSYCESKGYLCVMFVMKAPVSYKDRVIVINRAYPKGRCVDKFGIVRKSRLVDDVSSIMYLYGKVDNELCTLVRESEGRFIGLCPIKGKFPIYYSIDELRVALLAVEGSYCIVDTSGASHSFTFK